MRFVQSWWPVIGIALFLVGCGSGDQPALHSVTGTVTYGGKPLENATVTFVPEAGLAAVGRTDSAGRFTLRTRGMDGAMAGPFKVVIMAVEQVRKVSPEESENLTDAERRKLSKSLIPAKYSLPEESGLEATIIAGQKNDFTFALIL